MEINKYEKIYYLISLMVIIAFFSMLVVKKRRCLKNSNKSRQHKMHRKLMIDQFLWKP